MIFSIVLALESLTRFNESITDSSTRLTIGSKDFPLMKISEQYALFLASDRFHFSQCRYDLEVGEAIDKVVDIMGVLTDRKVDFEQHEIEIKLCGRSKGEIPMDPLKIMRMYTASAVFCQITRSDVQDFDGQSYQITPGNYWFIKSDKLNVQVKVVSFSNVPVVQQVAIQYMDELFVSTTDDPSFRCKSKTCSLSIKESQGSYWVINTPDNVELKISLTDFYDIVVNAPGEYWILQPQFLCKAGPAQLKDKKYLLVTNNDLFKSETVPLKASGNSGSFKCQLPIACDHVFDKIPTPVNNEEIDISTHTGVTIQPTETLSHITEAPLPSSTQTPSQTPNSYYGKSPTTGFVEIGNVLQTPNATVITANPVASINPAPNTYKCKDAFPIPTLQNLGIKYSNMLKNCENDYNATGFTSIVDSTHGAIQNMIYKKTNDFYYAANYTKVKDLFHYNENNCGSCNTGQCTQYGCTCPRGYGGDNCEIQYKVIPSKVSPISMLPKYKAFLEQSIDIIGNAFKPQDSQEVTNGVSNTTDEKAKTPIDLKPAYSSSNSFLYGYAIALLIINLN